MTNENLCNLLSIHAFVINNKVNYFVLFFQRIAYNDLGTPVAKSICNALSKNMKVKRLDLRGRLCVDWIFFSTFHAVVVNQPSIHFL